MGINSYLIFQPSNCRLQLAYIVSGTNQQAFIPSMIGPFLEVALLPEAELRTTLLEVLNDMLTCNFSEVCFLVSCLIQQTPSYQDVNLRC